MKTAGITVFLMIAWPPVAAIILCLSALVCAAAWVAIPLCRFKLGAEPEMRPFWIEATKDNE